MNAAARFPRLLRLVPNRRTKPRTLAPIEALLPAWRATVQLLFRPFLRSRWIRLSLICVLLGGGTTSAAFQWGFGSLPVDLRHSEFLFRIRQTIGQNPTLIVMAVAVSLLLVLGIIYARCVLRFALIDAIIKQGTADVAWRSMEPLGRSYFVWLVSVIGVGLAAASATMAATLHFANLLRAAGHATWIASLLLVSELVAVVLLGLLAAIVITLTDDLVAPVMYACRSSLPAAWKLVGGISRRDFGTFGFYVVLRFAISTAIGVAALFVLFPVLMGVSSTVLFGMALGTVGLRVLGMTWTWNLFTIGVGACALGALTAIVFALLSVAGMPGQVYLQYFGVRFIGSRVESVGALCRTPDAANPFSSGRM